MTDIELIKSRVSILDVFSLFGIGVKGRHALCPFHPDRKPSLAFRDTGLWHCFVCNTGGDIFTFVMKFKGLSFKDTVQFFNDTFNLGITKRKYKKNYYLEALDENYKTIKKSLKDEIEERITKYKALNKKHRWLWNAKDYTFVMLYDEILDLLEDKLRELENARYKYRREFASKDSTNN